jgi:hypothetical protein
MKNAILSAKIFARLSRWILATTIFLPILAYGQWYELQYDNLGTLSQSQYSGGDRFGSNGLSGSCSLTTAGGTITVSGYPAYLQPYGTFSTNWTITLSTPGAFYITYRIACGNTAIFGANISGTYTGPTVTGYVNPKYLIMGVTYAPPGGNAQSFASYADTSFVGNTSMNTSSFSQNYSESVAISGGAGCSGTGGGVAAVSGGACITGTWSNAWTLTSNSAKTVTTSKQTSLTLKTPGIPNVYSPVNHDYDIVWLWLNPVVFLTTPQSNTGCTVQAPCNIVWNGYGFDYNDPLHEIDVWPVYVGYLNGDFGPLDPQDADAFSRSWVTTQTFAAGQGPGITSADYPNILNADPFAKNPAYVVTLQSGTSPLTTTDGRFTQAGVNGVAPQTIPYKQAPPNSTTGENEMYQNTYVHTSTLGQGGSYTYMVGFGLEEKFGGSFFGIGVAYDFKQNFNFTWENTWQNTVTNTTTQVQTLSITGPPCPAPVAPCNPEFTEPHDFAAYEDNLYGTFMFWPNPYFSIGAVTPATQSVKAGSVASYTMPTTANAGYTGSLTSFAVTGLPTGSSAGFSPSKGAPGFTSTLAVSTAASTAAGTYPLTISATDGSLSYFTYASLVVSASPGFSIAASPATQTIGIASVTTYTVTTTATNGFNSVVNLNVTGLPSNVSAGFSPQTITGSGSSTLTITTTSNTPPGTYPLTITGTSGSLIETATPTLVVTGANFMLSATPEIQSINAGSRTTYAVTTTVMSGFNGVVSLSLSTLPSGATAAFNPTSITGAGASTLTITTTTSTPAGDYPLSITGTSGSLIQTAPIDLEVNN